jgi:Ran GTPase-activating protein 1
MLSLKSLPSLSRSLEELDLTCNSLGHAGAVAAAKAVVSNPGFKLLSLDDNHISEAGLEELEELFEGRREVLGPLDDNDEEGEEEEEEEEEEGEEEEEEGEEGAEAGDLAEKLGGLKV